MLNAVAPAVRPQSVVHSSASGLWRAVQVQQHFFFLLIFEVKAILISAQRGWVGAYSSKNSAVQSSIKVSTAPIDNHWEERIRFILHNATLNFTAQLKTPHLLTVNTEGYTHSKYHGHLFSPDSCQNNEYKVEELLMYSSYSMITSRSLTGILLS